MPAESLTARLIIDVREGKATRAIARVDSRLDRLRRTTRRLIRRGLRPFRQWIAIIAKALLSMIAVLAVFNLVLRPPQLALQGLISLIRATIATLSDFEQRILALQGILASTVIFLQDPVENFRNAGLVATSVVEQLALRANEMVVSLSEATVVFQTLLATGATRSISDVDKLIDLTILLSNAISGVAVGQGRLKQLSEETRSIFTQQLRANALLNNILFSNRREMLEFFKQAEASNTVVEQLAERLSGFSQVALQLGRTLEGIKTTAQTLLQVIARRAFGGILTEFETQASAIFEQIQSDTARLNDLAASLGAAVTVILNAILNIIQRIFGISIKGTENLLETVIGAIPGVTKLFLSILFAIERIAKVLVGVISLADIFRLIVLDIYQGIITLLRLILKGFQIIFGLISELRTFLGIDLLENAQSDVDSFSNDLRELDKLLRFDRIRTNVERIGVLLAGLITGPSISEQTTAAFREFYNEYLRNSERIEARTKAEEAALRNIITARRIDLSTNIEITGELLKQGRALRSQLSSVKEVVRLSLRGGVDRGVSNLLSRNILELEQATRAQIDTLGEQLQRNIFDISRTRVAGVISDTEQVKKLIAQNMNLRGEIAALAADLIGLNKIFAQIGATTAATLGQIGRDLLLGGVFKNLFALLTVEGAQLRSLFDGITTSIKNFITSAEGQVAVLAAVGNAISGAIKSSLSGAASFGQSLKRLLGDLLIALGEALIIAGSVSILFGLITLNATMIGQGLIAIAIGTGAIAAGLALGGGGGLGQGSGSGGGGSTGAAAGGTREFAFSEALVNVQQTANDLVVATDNLDKVTATFSGIAPGQVVERGLTEQGGATRVLARDSQSGRNLSSAVSTGAVLQGRT